MSPHSPETEVKSCPKCGNSFPGESVICTNCGTRLLRISLHQTRVTQGIPDQADQFFKEGCSLFRLRQFTDALLLFEKAIAIDTRHADAWSARGDVLSVLGRGNDASASYDIARAIHPDTPVSLTNRGSMLTELGRYADALSCIDKALAIQPDLAEAWEVRGEIFWNQGEYTDALAMFARALELKPDFEEAKLYRDMIRKALTRATPEGTPAMDSDDSRYIPSEIKGAVWDRDGGRCVICGSWKQLEYDHTVPFSRGGDNTVDNIRILCKKCKQRKPGKARPEDS